MQDFDPTQHYRHISLNAPRTHDVFRLPKGQLARRLQAPPQSFMTKKYVCELGVKRSMTSNSVFDSNMYSFDQKNISYYSDNDCYRN